MDPRGNAFLRDPINWPCPCRGRTGFPPVCSKGRAGPAQADGPSWEHSRTGIQTIRARSHAPSRRVARYRSVL